MNKQKNKRICILIVLLSILLFISGCAKADDNKEAIEENTEEETEENESYIPEAFVFTHDPYKISDEYLSVYGEGLEDVFYALVDSLIKGENSFSCPSEERMWQAIYAARCYCPVAYVFLKQDRCYFKNGTAHLSYTISGEELSEKYREFVAKVEDVMHHAIQYQEEDYIMAMELLSYLAEKNTVDEDSSLDTIMEISPYRAIMEDIGICQEFSGEYIYYLTQLGINAFPVSSLTADLSDAHEWVMMEIDGKYYHSDPMYSLSYPGSLYFFCMDDIQREYYGDFPLKYFNYLGTDVADRDKYLCTDRRFEYLWLAKEFEIDHSARRIRLRNINTDAYLEYPLNN